MPIDWGNVGEDVGGFVGDVTGPFVDNLTGGLDGLHTEATVTIDPKPLLLVAAVVFGAWYFLAKRR